MSRRHFAALAACVLFSAPCLHAQTATVYFRPRLDFGPYPVGFRVIQQYDQTRVAGTRAEIDADPSTRLRGRPIETLIWYPAAHRLRQQLRFVDYAETYSKPGKFPGTDAAGRKQAVAQLLEFLGQRDATSSFVQKELHAPVNGYRNAAPARGSFPIVVYGPGSQGPAIENELLGEYLASHGYIFVASPSWGAANDGFRSRLEPTARDLEYLVAFARSLPSANSKAVALVGHSWGGMANVLVASRNASITGVVSLEGSIAYMSSALDEAASSNALRDYRTPSLFINESRDEMRRLLHQYNLESSPEFDTEDAMFTFFESLKHADAYAVEIGGMRHRNFCSLEDRLLSPGTKLGFDDPVEFNPDRDGVARGYELMASYTLDFLDAVLKGDRKRLDKLDAPRNSWPANVTIVHKTVERQ